MDEAREYEAKLISKYKKKGEEKFNKQTPIT